MARFFKGGRLNGFEVEAFLKMALNAYRQEPLLFCDFRYSFFHDQQEDNKTKQNSGKFSPLKNTGVKKKMPVRTRKIKNQGVHNLFSPYRYQHFADSVRLCFQQTSLNGCFITLLCRFNTNTATTPQE